MADNDSIEASLARLERRLNELETLLRDVDRRTGGSTADRLAAAPEPPQRPTAHEPAITMSPAIQATDHLGAQEQPSIPASSPARQWTFTDLEELVTGRLLAWVGGLAIVVGAIFFLSMAFSNGWIGPGARVSIGLIASVIAIGAGAWFFERREALFGHVLVAVGLGVVSFSLLAATRLYDFVPAEVGLLGALTSAVIAAGIAVRAESQVVAAYGLVAALIAPPLLGASPNLATVGFLATALIGTVIISLERTWTWLPPIAFLFSAPQVADWLVDDAAAGTGLIVLAGFWVLYALASGGEEFRKPSARLRPSSATVLLANAAFLVWVGFALLEGDLERWRGLFLVTVAVAHGVLGGYFLRDRHDRHPFGLLAFGAGVAAISMAVPVQLGGPPVPLAWAAEATALAWLYGQRRHGYSAVVAVILGTLAIGHLFSVEYPFWEIADGVESDIPFLNASGATLAFVVFAFGLSSFLVRSSGIRSLLATGSILLVAVAVPFELQTPWVAVTAWSTLAGGAFALIQKDARETAPYLVAAQILIAGGVIWTLASIAPIGRLTVESLSSIDHPLFWSPATGALASIVATLAFGSWVRRAHRDWRLLAIPAALLAVFLLSVGVVDEFQGRVGGPSSLASVQEQSQVTLSILWAVLGGIVFVVGVLRLGAVARSFGLALLALASAKVFIYDLASLDATYRVLSFIGLGVLLLASSFAYQHFMPLIERQVSSRASLDETPRS